MHTADSGSDNTPRSSGIPVEDSPTTVRNKKLVRSILRAIYPEVEERVINTWENKRRGNLDSPSDETKQDEGMDTPPGHDDEANESNGNNAASGSSAILVAGAPTPPSIVEMFQDLKKDINDMKTKVEGVTTEMTDMKTAMEGVKTEVKEVNEKLSELSRHSGTHGKNVGMQSECLLRKEMVTSKKFPCDFHKSLGCRSFGLLYDSFAKTLPGTTKDRLGVRLNAHYKPYLSAIVKATIGCGTDLVDKYGESSEKEEENENKNKEKDEKKDKKEDEKEDENENKNKKKDESENKEKDEKKDKKEDENEDENENKNKNKKACCPRKAIRSVLNESLAPASEDSTTTPTPTPTLTLTQLASLARDDGTELRNVKNLLGVIIDSIQSLKTSHKKLKTKKEEEEFRRAREGAYDRCKRLEQILINNETFSNRIEDHIELNKDSFLEKYGAGIWIFSILQGHHSTKGEDNGPRALADRIAKDTCLFHKQKIIEIDCRGEIKVTTETSSQQLKAEISVGECKTNPSPKAKEQLTLRLNLYQLVVECLYENIVVTRKGYQFCIKPTDDTVGGQDGESQEFQTITFDELLAMQPDKEAKNGKE